MRLRCWATLLLVLPLLTGCEGYFRVVGRVVDPSGAPVPRALVQVGEDGSVYAHARTDSAGGFELGFVYPMPSTRAPLRVESPGYYVDQRLAPFDDSITVVLAPRSAPRPGLIWGDVENVPSFGVQYGRPLGFSATLEVRHGRRAGYRHFAGNVAALEAGQGGAKAGFGYARLGPRYGAGVSAAVLRTIGNPLSVAERQTFAGAEARLLRVPLTLTFGGYGRIAGKAPGDTRMFAFTVGMGR
jgi:hypothetical protein